MEYTEISKAGCPRVLHHVMGRGIERRDIFLSDKDRNDFITRLATLAQQGDLDVYAWALLPNTSIYWSKPEIGLYPQVCVIF